jgi:arylsulfatase A-like enzyme
MARPNLLIFMTDHQRADTALVDHPSITPNLDRLAREGITFTNTYCPSPHCCPARATFFSGLYPSRHGVWNNICNRQALSYGLKPGVRLWSEDLAEAGYEQHFSGKWHVSVEEGPGDRGWTEHFVSAGKGTLHGVTWDRYRQIATEPDPTVRGEGEILRAGYGTYQLYGTRDRHGDQDQRVVSEGLDLIPRLTDSDQPWTLYLGLSGPHDPYMVPQQFLDMVDLEDVELPANYADDMADKPGVYQKMRAMRFGQLSEREVREAIRHYWAYCSYLDAMFGQILNALEESGQVDNTLVLYTSDHADYVGEHGLFAKGIPCFQGAYHIPAVIRWPAGICNPGRMVDALVSEADFAPTFLDVAGVKFDRYFTGASLLPFLFDQEPKDWRTAIHTQCNGVELYYTQRSVMTKEYKYTFNGFDRDELYDLRQDPYEMINLANDPAYEVVKRGLCGEMWRFAYQEDDTAINPYITVSLAPYGPAEAFRS